MRTSKIFKTKQHTFLSIQKKVEQWKKEGKTIVFSNGCFDILHLGHIDYLLKAASFGDVLVIGLNSDISVKLIKGSNRPIIDEKSRAMVLAALCFVEAVVLFDEETPLKLINIIKPDILVKGKDYQVKDVVGYQILKSYGGKVKTVKLVEGYSTTAIEKRIRALNVLK